MTAVLFLALLAGGDPQWAVRPASPTVGDTIWLTRVVAFAPDLQPKPAPFDSQGDIASLGDPTIRLMAGGAVLRYAVVAWTAGPHHFALPTLWLIGAGGRSDSVAGGAVDVTVRSVLPADPSHATPKSLLPPIDSAPTSPWWPLAALVIGAAVLFVLVRLRRRGPRATQPAAEFVTAGGSPDDRWLSAGEPKAVAARATRALREALARVVPDATDSLPVREALAAAEGRMPGATFRRVREALLTLDQVSFAVAHGADVARVAAEARALARELG